MLFYRKLSIHQKQVVWAWAFLALPVLFYVVIRFYPTLNAIVLSFQSWNLLGPALTFSIASVAALAAAVIIGFRLQEQSRGTLQ